MSKLTTLMKTVIALSLVIIIAGGVAVYYFFDFVGSDDYYVDNPKPQSSQSKDNENDDGGKEEEHSEDYVPPHVVYNGQELGLNDDEDGDGLSNEYEVNVSFTDPLKFDTAGDGMSDGAKIAMGLNPHRVDSFGDGILDKNRTLSYNHDDKELGVTLKMTGKGNLPLVSASRVPQLEGSGGILRMYNFHTEGILSHAEIQIKYEKGELTDEEENSLVISHFDPVTGEFTDLVTSIDKGLGVLRANTEHFSFYAVLYGDEKQSAFKDVFFCLDNSGSMRSNDESGLRIDASIELINRLKANQTFCFGVSKFGTSYTSLARIGASGLALKALESMKSSSGTDGGTYIGDALYKSAESMSVSRLTDKFIILLTDGQDTNSDANRQRMDEAIALCKLREIKVLVIGLGQGIDTTALTNIASETDGMFFNAPTSENLNDIYIYLAGIVNNGLVDLDGDGVVDHVTIAESKFDPQVNGFNFKNIKNTVQSEGGLCYGMALFAQLYYQKKLPFKLDDISFSNINSAIHFGITKKAKGYDLTNSDFFTLYNPLYDFNADILTLYKNFEFINPFEYYDFDDVNKRYEFLKEEWQKYFDDLGYTYRKLDKGGALQRDLPVMDIESDLLLQNGDSESVNLVRAINRLYILQVTSSNFFFAPYKLGFSVTSTEHINKVEENLKDDIPVLIGIKGNGIDHAVNAMGMYASLSNPNKFVISVYDNNAQGKTSYMYATKYLMLSPVLEPIVRPAEVTYTYKIDFKDLSLLETYSLSRFYCPDVTVE